MPWASKVKQYADTRRYEKRISQWEVYDGEKYVETVQFKQDADRREKEGYRVKKIS